MSTLALHVPRLRRSGLAGTAAIAVLAVSLASSAGASAATVTLPSTAQLTAAVDALITNQTDAGSLAAELADFGSSPTTSYLGVIDTIINADVGSTVIAVPAHSAPAGPALEATLGVLPDLLASTPTATQGQALAEVRTYLTSGGLTPLLDGPTGNNPTTAISELKAMQTLTPGASSPVGTLPYVAAIVNTLASEATGTDASSLSAAASALNAGVTAPQLQGVISELESVTSTTSSATAGVTIAQMAAAIATQLAESGALMGGLESVGATLSAGHDPTDLGTALSQLSALEGLAPSADASMPEIAAVLDDIAATPDVSGTSAASALGSVAGSLAGSGPSPSQLLTDISTLQSLSSILPSPLNTLASGLATAIATSGTVFGDIAGLTGTNANAALSELSTLESLAANSDTPELPGIAAVLNQVSSDIPGGDSNDSAALGDLVTVFSDSTLGSSDLAGAAQALAYIAQTLPSPEQATIADIAADLSSVAANIAGPDSSSSSSSVSVIGSGPTSSSAATSTGTTASTSPSTSPTTSSSTDSSSSSSSTKADNPAADALQRAARTGNAVMVTLSCSAATGTSCTDTVSASAKGFVTVTKKVKLKAGKTTKLRFKLAARLRTGKKTRRHTVKAATIKLVVKTGSHRASKLLK